MTLVAHSAIKRTFLSLFIHIHQNAFFRSDNQFQYEKSRVSVQVRMEKVILLPNFRYVTKTKRNVKLLLVFGAQS